MLKALLVEDEILVRELVADELGDAGFDVVAVGNSDEALAALAATSFDLLFTDIQMPGAMNGWELGREACAACPDLRVVYSTGYGREASALSDRERCIGKPYRYDVLLQVLHDLGLSPIP